MGFPAANARLRDRPVERGSLMHVRLAASEEALLQASRDFLCAFPCRDLPLLPPTDPRGLRTSQDLLLLAVGLLDPGLRLGTRGRAEALRQFACEVIRRIQLLRGVEPDHPAMRIAASRLRPAARLH